MKDGAGCVIQDLRHKDSVAEAMSKALKSHLSRDLIRGSVKHLDFSRQLNKIVDICIEDSKE